MDKRTELIKTIIESIDELKKLDCKVRGTKIDKWGDETTGSFDKATFDDKFFELSFKVRA